MRNKDAILNVRGESCYVDDLSSAGETLVAEVFSSEISHGEITHLDLSKAKSISGVIAIFTANDIPGKNQIGNIIEDEPLLAEDKVDYIGQPIALIVADSNTLARKAMQEIKIKYKKMPTIFDPREAFSKGHLIAPQRVFSLGDIDNAWNKCDMVVEGTVESGGQEHLYLETQSSLAIPNEYGVKVISSTQSPTVVQRAVAKVLGISMNKVEIDVIRLGGAFGGKEDQATSWAAMAALAASKLGKPVKITLSRNEDMNMTGKRHPYSSDFKIGLKNDGRIIAYDVNFYQNAGASADLSTSILERTLFHATNSYFISNVRATAASCRTNSPPNTAFRGFGAPQAMFVIESAIFKAAEKMGLDPRVIQEKNLIKENDIFPYGMRAVDSLSRKTWAAVDKKYNIKKIYKEVEKFNLSNTFFKKGVAIMPICFGISFTNKFLNQASALVHVYTDGSVSVSISAVEMGQGVNEKIKKVAASVFGIDTDMIKVESTNTSRVANTSPTAASADIDMNGNAVRLACEIILNQMKKAALKKLGCKKTENVVIQSGVFSIQNKKKKIRWNDLILYMYQERISLSAQAHYATPKIYFNKDKEKGAPFLYHVYGTAIIEVLLDCMRGRYKIESAKIVHDCGKSLDPIIDMGQIEGALIQGLGWMTIEDLIYDKEGRLMTDALSTYKVPDMHYTPEIHVEFLENSENPKGLFGSKGVGEPPFMYGIGAYFAILKAMKDFRKNLEPFFFAPLTFEKVLLSLFPQK